MNRRKFLYSSCAVIFLAGTSGLTSCSEDDPGNNNGGGGTGSKLTADLSTELTSVGNAKSGNNVIVVRTAAGNVPESFVALTTVCTHQACTVEYKSGSNRFECPCHGSIYSISGSVLQGPAPLPLTRYAVSIDGNKLTVS